MVETRLTKMSAEVLADEGLSGAVDRVDAQSAFQSSGATQINLAKFSLEVLAAPSATATGAVDRVDAQSAFQSTGSTEVHVVKFSMEVLGGAQLSGSVDRVDAQSAFQVDGASEVQLTRLVLEGLARESGSGSIVPQALNSTDFFLHNWEAQSEITSSWSTSISGSPYTQAESRRGLQVRPTRTMTCQWLITGDQLRRLQLFMERSSGSFIQMPIYADQVETTGVIPVSSPGAGSAIPCVVGDRRFFVGQRVAVVEPDETVNFYSLASVGSASIQTVEDVAIEVAAGAKVFPLMDVQPILSPDVESVSNTVQVVRLAVEEAPGESKLLPQASFTPPSAPTYSGRAIWDIEPDWSSAVQNSFIRPGDSSAVGRASFVSALGERSVRTVSFAVSGTRADADKHRQWFDAMRGRLTSFWFIDLDNWRSIVSVDAAGGYIDFEKDGTLAEFSQNYVAQGLLRKDGTYQVSTVSSITETAGAYRVTLDDPFGALTVADIDRLAPARLMRFDSDEMQEVWDTAGVYTSEVNLVEVINEEEHTL